MKQKNLLKNALMFLLMFTISSISAQIYNADFSNEGDGFADHTSASPPADAPASVGPFGSTGNQWLLSYTSKPGTDSSANSFKVVDGALLSDDWGGQGIFQSQSIDVSSINTVDISAISQNSGANDDNFTYFYILDGGSRVETPIGETNSGDAVNYSITSLDVSGNTSLIVGFEFSENGGSQGYTTSSFTVSESIISPTVTFDSATSSETETDATFTSANIPISVTNYDGNQIDIDVAITGGTAEPSDYSYTTQSLSFSSDSTQNITIDINDDVDTDDETIIFTITETSSVTGLVISQATHTLTITDDDLPNIIINEILASPGTSTTASDSNFGDANGDGLRPNSREDEFIEIVNLETTIVNIGGYTISETNGVVHTFSDPTNLPAGGSIVVFGGGTPTDIPGLSVTSSSGNLELSNSGETVTLKNSEGTTINVVTYSSLSNQSFARNFDLTGAGTGHNSIVSNPVNFSPGRYNTTGEPFTTNTWTGATDTSWTEASNWSLGTVPGSGDDVQIINTTNQPLASGAVTVNSVTIASGATLTAQSTFTGSVTYNRSLATDNWYLMSSPVSGETYDSSWVIDNNIDDTTSSNGNIGIATYTTTDDTWSYLQTGGSGAFTNGKGFSIKQDATGTVSFTGTLNTSDVSAAVATGGIDGYNLIGNPFTTNLSSAMFLTGNTANLTSETIWVWNQGTGTYDAYVTGESFILAPTQGFFVSASAATNLTLAESYQTSTAGTFQKSANPKIELYVTDGTNKRFVKMYYNPTATKSFDNGYDGEIFGGIKNSFELYTNLISNNVGKKYQVQSLPNSDLETMVIPVGVMVEANKEITFTAEALNLPSGIKVFLEDRFTNTFTRLDEANSEYKFTSDVALDGTGRFYLHTKSSALNIESLDLDNVSIYKTDNSNLRVVGLSEGKASIKLYNIIGKQVLNSSFTANGVQDITLPSLAKGIYIVQLETETGKLNKKITLE